MNNAIIYKALFTLTLICFGITQDVYPNFSDPIKQFKFEEKRIYVKESQGERTILSGGDSYTELANPLGTIFLDQDPDYISKNNPIKTSVEYWYNFTIEQNNIELTELEFLSILGLNDKIKEITLRFKTDLEDYSRKIGLADNIKESNVTVNKGWLSFEMSHSTIDYTKHNSYYYDDLHKNKTKNSLIKLTTLLAICVIDWDGLKAISLKSYSGDVTYHNLFAISSFLLLSDILTEKDRSIKKIEWEYPDYRKLESPILKQSLSAEQITSLADSYNRKIYNQIKNNIYE